MRRDCSGQKKKAAEAAFIENLQITEAERFLPGDPSVL